MPDFFSTDYEMPLALDEGITTPAQTKDLTALPDAVAFKSLPPPSQPLVSSSPLFDADPNTCSVCLSAFDADDLVRSLP
ncbi:hypothetical protein DIPPA_22427 [Diplonema papillatum]|nr:hypothetical protein DIPPA_22427 [Diplonema papillatum]